VWRRPELFVTLPESKQVTNRVHLDLVPLGRRREQEVDRLLGLGERLADDDEPSASRGQIQLDRSSSSREARRLPSPLLGGTERPSSRVFHLQLPRRCRLPTRSRPGSTALQVTGRDRAGLQAGQVGQRSGVRGRLRRHRQRLRRLQPGPRVLRLPAVPVVARRGSECAVPAPSGRCQQVACSAIDAWPR